MLFCMENFDCKQVRGLDNKVLTLKTVPMSLKQKPKWPIWITQRPHLTKIWIAPDPITNNSGHPLSAHHQIDTARGRA